MFSLLVLRLFPEKQFSESPEFLRLRKLFQQRDCVRVQDAKILGALLLFDILLHFFLT